MFKSLVLKPEERFVKQLLVRLFLQAQTDSLWLPATEASLKKKKKEKKRTPFSEPICTNKAAHKVGSKAAFLTTNNTETFLASEWKLGQWKHRLENTATLFYNKQIAI